MGNIASPQWGALWKNLTNCIFTTPGHHFQMFSSQDPLSPLRWASGAQRPKSALRPQEAKVPTTALLRHGLVTMAAVYPDEVIRQRFYDLTERPAFTALESDPGFKFQAPNIGLKPACSDATIPQFNIGQAKSLGHTEVCTTAPVV